jgi:hypothetical protein
MTNYSIKLNIHFNWLYWQGVLHVDESSVKRSQVSRSGKTRWSSGNLCATNLCPLAVTSMLACARIGAVHSFAGFSAEALATRINDGIHSFNLTLFKLF